MIVLILIRGGERQSNYVYGLVYSRPCLTNRFIKSWKVA